VRFHISAENWARTTTYQKIADCMDVDQPGCSDTSDILVLSAQLRTKREPFVLATVIEAEGSTSASVGGKAIFDPEGAVITGWVGGACAESTVAHPAVECIESEQGQIIELDLKHEVLGTGRPCGGAMKVFVEPVLPRPVLWLLGHGRVAECLCRLGAMMGFDVVVDDPFAERTRFPEASRLIVEDSNYNALQPKATDFVIVATQHKGDHQSMARLLASDVQYIGLIASHKREGLVLDYLRGLGFDDAARARVRTPAGLGLGAEIPEEIALSIIAEVVLLRRRGTASPAPESLERDQAGAGARMSSAAKNAADAMA
jgi:xanthine dehydrogenase accessory factor